MNEPRCIAQLLRNESPRAIDFTITHGKGRKGIIIRTKKQSPLKKALVDSICQCNTPFNYLFRCFELQCLSRSVV